VAFVTAATYFPSAQVRPPTPALPTPTT
jgi:hypothetical protein